MTHILWEYGEWSLIFSYDANKMMETDRHTDGQTERQMDRQTDGQTQMTTRPLHPERSRGKTQQRLLQTIWMTCDTARVVLTDIRYRICHQSWKCFLHEIRTSEWVKLGI